MRYVLPFVFAFVVCVVRASPIFFSPVVRNYTVPDYGAGAQNWAVSQDKRGVMYFGNSKGLLEFDGNTWTLYQLPTEGVVRSVYVAEDGKIYVGSYEEFGYFEPSSDGTDLEYRSLKSEMSDFDFHNDEIWTICPVDGKILFHSFNSLFFYDGETVSGIRLNKLLLNLFKVGDVVYQQQMRSGLAVFKEGQVQETISYQTLHKNEIKAVFPYMDGNLLLFMQNGTAWVWTGSRLRKQSLECEEELKRYIVNHVVLTKDSCYVVGTISGGIYALGKNGRLLWKVNTDNGLSNNTVLGLYCDTDNNIWASLDDGIAYIQSNSLVYCYEPKYRKIGMVYDVLVTNENAYIASNQGLYSSKGEDVELMNGLEEQAWFVKREDGQIFCGHNKGTFQLSGQQAELISKAAGSMCLSEMEIEGRQYLLGGTYSHLNLYEKNIAGQWRFVRQLDDFSQMAWKIEVDHRGNVWVEHLRKGLYRFRISSDLNSVENVRRYMTLGNISNSRFTLFKINGRVVFSNGQQFYTYEDINDTIVPYKTMNEQLAELEGIHSVSYAKDNMYWFVGNRMAYLVNCDMNEFRVLRRIPFSLFGNDLMEERATAVYDPERCCSYLCLNNAVARIQDDSVELYTNPSCKEIWISAMTAENAAGEECCLPVQEYNELDFDWNSVCFSLSYPAYNDYVYQVRYKLEGFTGQWQEGKRMLEARYFRLPPGKYTFCAEVYNEKGILSSVKLPFVILRPWYTSYGFITVYVILGLLLLFLSLYTVYHVVKRKKERVIAQQQMLHQVKMELQEKRIVALENEQLKADLRFKSKELAERVMTNIAHQKVLASLKSEIQQLRLAGQYTRKNLDRLLSMVNNNLVSSEDNWNTFQSNFDRIHENFFRNLKAQYPELTSADLRLCALLRLNMPTKEIAQFLNISVRGVDAARYRLRKKFDLSSEDSLTDFIINFK